MDKQPPRAGLRSPPSGFYNARVSIVAAIILFLVFAKTIVALGLEVLNARHVKARAGSIPSAWQGLIDAATYERSTHYTLAKANVSLFGLVLESAVLLAILFSGVIGVSYNALANLWGYDVLGQTAWLVTAIVLVEVPSLPLEYYVHFHLEKRFGFNRMSGKLWLIDKAKELVLGLLIGLPIAALIIGLITWFGRGWWLIAFLAVMAFQLVVAMLFPRVILPLFNKLTPLPDGELRDKIVEIASKTGFTMSAIDVMDGSKRSTHSNAFFAGLGRFRRIVLFDTLIEKASLEEIAAVLAHEIGHSKLNHITRSMVLSAITAMLGFAASAELLERPWLYEALDLPRKGVAPCLFAFTLLAGVITFWMGPVFHYVSRRFEYEADTFAKRAVGTGEYLIGALRKLAEQNLSNLVPHPWYSFFYYSHPTVEERLQNLRSGGRAPRQ